MGIDDAPALTGGTWINLKNTGDNTRGVFVTETERQKTFEGQVVMKRGTNDPRIEHVIRLQTPPTGDDDGIRLVTADEAAWNKILEARDELKKTEPGWSPSQPGSVLAIQVTATTPAGAGVQRTYAAKWWKGEAPAVQSSMDTAASTAPAPQGAVVPTWDEEPF